MPLFRKKVTMLEAPETRDAQYSIGDPALAQWLGISGMTHAGVTVDEASSIGLTAVFRAVSIIAGTAAGLPLKTYRTLPDGTRERVSSFLDNPGGSDGLTPFEWTELVLVHLLLHGNAYLLHVYGGAGQIVALLPLHPSIVTVCVEDGQKVFKTLLADGSTREYTSADLTHVPGLGTDGLVGLSPISFARQSLGTAIAGDQAAARMFGNGLLVGGIVTADETLGEEDAKTVKAGLTAKMQGVKNAGDLAFVNANLKFQPWTMSSVDAQFLESRAFGVAEVARLFGVPKMLLAEDGASTWGTGIAELNRGLARYTLTGWTSRLEQRLSRLLPASRFGEYDYAGLLEGTPAEVTQNLAAEIAAGLLTNDEARRILNRPPLPVEAGDSGGSLADKVNAATALIRAGFDPASALEACGLPAVTHLGLLPVTLQKEEQFDAEADLAAAEASAPISPASGTDQGATP